MVWVYPLPGTRLSYVWFSRPWIVLRFVQVLLLNPYRAVTVKLESSETNVVTFTFDLAEGSIGDWNTCRITGAIVSACTVSSWDGSVNGPS